MEFKSENKLPFKLIDRLKINTYAYLLSSINTDRNKRNELVNNYELATYKNRVHEYCSKNSHKYTIHRQFTNNISSYDACCDLYGCNCCNPK